MYIRNILARFPLEKSPALQGVHSHGILQVDILNLDLWTYEAMRRLQIVF